MDTTPTPRQCKNAPRCLAVDGEHMRRKKPTLSGWIHSSPGLSESAFFYASERVTLDADGLCRVCRAKP